MERSGYAYFVERPRVMEDLLVPHPIERERRYEIAKVIKLAGIDYENFVTDMIADRQFIENHASLCRTGETWRCLLVQQRGRTDGVLVMPTAAGRVAWAAYCKE